MITFNWSWIKSIHKSFFFILDHFLWRHVHCVSVRTTNNCEFNDLFYIKFAVVDNKQDPSSSAYKFRYGENGRKGYFIVVIGAPAVAAAFILNETVGGLHSFALIANHYDDAWIFWYKLYGGKKGNTEDYSSWKRAYQIKTFSKIAPKILFNFHCIILHSLSHLILAHSKIY